MPSDPMMWLVLCGAVLFAFIVFVILLRRFVRNIPQGKLGIVERKYVGNKMTTGRVYATKGEIGIEAQYLKPGLHFLLADKLRGRDETVVPGKA